MYRINVVECPIKIISYNGVVVLFNMLKFQGKVLEM